MHVGIVILNYNGSEYLKLCLESITKASTKVQFSIGVIDNGSDPKDAEKAAKYFSIYVEQNSQMSGFFFGSKQNLGFSGGNNVVIKRFLEDKSITHICMINSMCWLRTNGSIFSCKEILMSLGRSQTQPEMSKRLGSTISPRNSRKASPLQTRMHKSVMLLTEPIAWKRKYSTSS